MTYPTKTVSVQDLIEDTKLQLDLVGSVIQLDVEEDGEHVVTTGTVQLLGVLEGGIAVVFEGSGAGLEIDADDLEGLVATVSFVDYGAGL